MDARRLLLATDLHGPSRSLVDVARRYCTSTGSAVTLVHAVERSAAKGVSRALRSSLLGEWRAEAEAGLARQGAELAEAGIEVGPPILAVDLPAHRVVLDAVETTGAGLVLVGSGSRAGRGHRIGSTADRLLRSSPVPILVVRGRPSVPFRTLAFLTDFSARSRRAHLVGARLLPRAEEGVRTYLLHAGDEALRVIDPGLEGRMVTRAVREAAALDGALGSPAAPCRPRVAWGTHPVDTLLSAVSEDDYDAVVLGTHGHGPLRRALIGSVAMGLAQSAPCSVLVVPGN